jgi:hypothetical protein
MLNSLFSGQSDLFYAFIGAVFGYVLPYLVQFIRLIIYRLSKNQIEGVWYNHFFSSDGEQNLFIVEKIAISKGLSEKYSVKSEFVDNPKAKYKGRLVLEKDFLIFEMHAKNHQENAYSRFSTPPIFTNSTVLVGLSLAQDFSGISTSASNLLARLPLQEAEVIHQMAERVKINSKLKTLRVLK